ncbi:MAG: hypothetical protein IIB17_10470 [Chloroflexi bacterium]|nr:hypothetical protein [Chloroflexota bacterium]
MIGEEQMVYGSKAAHQLCQFHLLQEARKFAVKIVDLTDGHATYWCRKALAQGLIHLRTGQDRYKTTSRLERFQREIRRRDSMGTLWSPHNLLILLQRRGLISSTT